MTPESQLVKDMISAILYRDMVEPCEKMLKALKVQGHKKLTIVIDVTTTKISWELE